MSKRDRHHGYALVALALALAAVALLALFDFTARHYAGQPVIQGEECHPNGQPDRDNAPIVSCLRDFDPREDTYAQWIMAIFAFAATGVSLWAVKLLNGTLEATRDAVRSADDAVAATREVGRAQTRAYVHVVGIEIRGLNGDGDPRVHVNFKNFGQTPALNVRNKIYTSVSFKGNEPVENDLTFKEEIGSPIGPSQERGTTTFLGDLMAPIIKFSGENGVFVQGKIEYRDVYGISRHTKFRGRFHFGGGKVDDTDAFVLTKDGNEAT